MKAGRATPVGRQVGNQDHSSPNPDPNPNQVGNQDHSCMLGYDAVDNMLFQAPGIVHCMVHYSALHGA